LNVAAAILKLSKLQKHILLQALEGWEQIQEKSTKLAAENPEKALAIGPPAQKPDAIYQRGVLYLHLELPHPSQRKHVSRSEILQSYYGLFEHQKKWNQSFDARDPKYASANACFYRAIKSLEERGLIRRGSGYERGDLWLTKLGLEAAKAVRSCGST
jgi:hypothetical protein